MRKATILNMLSYSRKGKTDCKKLIKTMLFFKVSGQGRGVSPCMATYQEKDDSIVVVEG